MPRPILQGMADRSVDWWVMSEDLPDPENRVTLGSDGRVNVRWQPNNRVAHEKLISAARKMMQDAGYPFVAVAAHGHRHQLAPVRYNTLWHGPGHVRAGSVLPHARG